MTGWKFWQREQEQRAQTSIADPAVALLLGYGTIDAPAVSETVAATLSAVYRSVSLIAGTMGTLPLRTLQDGQDGRREKVRSWLDTPDGPDGFTQMEWTELGMVHLLLHGTTYWQHIYNGANQIVAGHPVHPRAVTPEWDSSRPGGKKFTVTKDDGSTETFDARTMTQVMGWSFDGLEGVSCITRARMSLGTALAGDKSANRQFTSGAMISGLVSPDDDEDLDDATEMKEHLDRAINGPDKAGGIAYINRKLKFQPWTLSAVDAQFLQSRAFQVEEVGRWFGLPPHLLGQTEKSTSWGSGIQEQNRGLARYTLKPWSTRIEQRASRLLPPNKQAEFDYSSLLQPSPEDEIELLNKQIDSGLLTLNEARKIRNLPPVEGGDIPRIPSGDRLMTEIVPAGANSPEGGE